MRKYLLSIVVFVLAFGIFLVSVLHSSPLQVFANTLPTPTPDSVVKGLVIDYVMPFPGKVLPDNPLWNLKAARDWVWYFVTFNPLRKAELALMFSDKRLMSSKTLFELQKPEIAVSTFTKGEKYLEIAATQEEIARKAGVDTSNFAFKLANAALKHRQITEAEVLPIAPEDAKPHIIKDESYSRNAYKLSREALNSMGKISPKDPFNGQ